VRARPALQGTFTEMRMRTSRYQQNTKLRSLSAMTQPARRFLCIGWTTMGRNIPFPTEPVRLPAIPFSSSPPTRQGSSGTPWPTTPTPRPGNSVLQSHV